MTSPCGQGTVLIVEDDPSIRETLAEVLLDEGYRVRTAENGKEALDMIAGGFVPCIMLLDLMMPVMTGWEVVQHLEHDAGLHHVPYCVISAIASAAPPTSECVLNKPINLDELLSVVAKHCAPGRSA